MFFLIYFTMAVFQIDCRGKVHFITINLTPVPVKKRKFDLFGTQGLFKTIYGTDTNIQHCPTSFTLNQI